jgi:hypothetical protein
MLDPADQLAAPIARGGEALPIHIEETETAFAVAWTGNHRIEGDRFIFRDTDSGNTRTIFGYPAARIARQLSRTPGSA